MLKIEKIQDDDELYEKFARQSDPQDVNVELDLDLEVLSCEIDHEIGPGAPVRVWNGFVRRYSIPALKANAANTLLASIAPLAERVIAGYESRWDGNEHVADLDDDAVEAEESIEQLCRDASDDNDQHLIVWTAVDWYRDCERGQDREERRASMGPELGITARTSDAQLARVASAEAVKAASEGVNLIDGLDEYLESVYVALKQQARERAANK